MEELNIFNLTTKEGAFKALKSTYGGEHGSFYEMVQKILKASEEANSWIEEVKTQYNKWEKEQEKAKNK